MVTIVLLVAVLSVLSLIFSITSLVSSNSAHDRATVAFREARKVDAIVSGCEDSGWAGLFGSMYIPSRKGLNQRTEDLNRLFSEFVSELGYEYVHHDEKNTWEKKSDKKK